LKDINGAKPRLTAATLRRIVGDHAPSVHGLRRVGLVGSYAREDYSPASDVDLVFDMDETFSDETFTETGVLLRSIFMDQFRKELDIIRYASIFACLHKPEKLTESQLKGYKKMLEDLVWIWGE
jgi:predicted nucleotidyltransferase